MTFVRPTVRNPAGLFRASAGSRVAYRPVVPVFDNGLATIVRWRGDFEERGRFRAGGGLPLQYRFFDGVGLQTEGP
jgi:hypothetical protein